MELPVDSWIEAAREGDRAAREALGEWCWRRAYKLACVDLGSKPDRQTLAEDVAVEASVKAIDNLHRFQPGTRFDQWLHCIVRNCLRDAYRRSEQQIPSSVYDRWIHDFLAQHRADLELLVQRECGREPSLPHPAIVERIATDLRGRSYRQFMRLTYEDQANVVLAAVKSWLRSFVAVDIASLYERDEEGEWVEIEVEQGDVTQEEILQRELVQQVNGLLAELLPICRRMIRWYYMERLRMPDIAQLEQLPERTAYRRLEKCAAAFRDLLMRDGYFAEYAPRGNKTEVVAKK
jgi:RNA polymerase sigma factor (sigma-70 family)